MYMLGFRFRAASNPSASRLDAPLQWIDACLHALSALAASQRRLSAFDFAIWEAESKPTDRMASHRAKHRSDIPGSMS